VNPRMRSTVGEQIAREHRLEIIRAAIAGSAQYGTGRPCDRWDGNLCALAGSYHEPHSQAGCWCWAQAVVVANALDESTTTPPPEPKLDEPYICPRCGSHSYNPNDMEQRYCGRCHRFEAT
jgi:hypothetical protein